MTPNGDLFSPEEAKHLAAAFLPSLQVVVLPKPPSLCVCCLQKGPARGHTAQVEVLGSHSHFSYLSEASAPSSGEIFVRHKAELKGALSLVLPVALTSFCFVILVTIWSFQCFSSQQ